MRMDAHHFVAAAFEGDLVDTVVDVAKVQVEGLGKGFDLVGDLDEFRVLVLGNAIDAHGRDCHQFAQGFGGCAAVFDPRIKAEQAMDFVLLLSAQGLVVEEGADGRAEVVGFAQIALGQAAEELPEVLHRSVVEGLEDGRALLRGDVGVRLAGERREAGQHQGSGSQVLE
ncbi:hypothetical protein D3C81_1231670 [compost metagenome]